jgi:hypothetical protein
MAAPHNPILQLLAGLPDQRPSASADAVRRREIERTNAMTPHERMLLALSLGARLRKMFPEVAERERARKRHNPRECL